MQRRVSQRKDTLGHLVHLYQQVDVKLLELGVQLEEFPALDVPVKAAGVM